MTTLLSAVNMNKIELEEGKLHVRNRRGRQDKPGEA